MLRGRKRSTKPRHPGGKIKEERVGATPEQQSRRKYLSGEQTSYPLGILLVNEGIDEHEHRAGVRYAWLYQVVYGKMSIAAQSFERTPRGSGVEMDDLEFIKLEREVNQAIAELAKLGCRKAVDSVCFGPTPEFMKPRPPTLHDVYEGNSMKAGLKGLMGVLSDG